MKFRTVFLIFLVASLLVFNSMLFATGQAPDNGSGEDSNFNAAGYPIVDEPITLKIFISVGADTDDPETFPVFQEILEKANINIDWDIDRSGTNDTVNLILASGDFPDIFWAQTPPVAEIIKNPDLFLKMDEYIDKGYTPNISFMFADDPVTKVWCTLSDGHIYGLPIKAPLRPQTLDQGFINSDWLERLNLDMPVTTDDFYKTLQKFKTQDPNENNVADEVPYSGLPWGIHSMMGVGNFLPAFGVNLNYDWIFVEMNNGKVRPVATRPEYKEAIQWLRKLYAEELIDQEYFTNGWENYVGKIRDPKGTKVGTGFGWTIEDVCGKERLDEYVELPPLVGPRGDQVWRSSAVVAKAGANRLVVNAEVAYPAATMRFLDMFYDMEVTMQLVYGSFGKTLKKNSDGTIEFLPTPEGYTDGEWKWKNALDQLGSPGFTNAAFEGKIRKGAGNEAWGKWESDERYSKYYDQSSSFPWVSYWDPAIQDEKGLIEADINKYIEESFAKWIAEGGIEEE